ncbi:short chain dehydrogenase domain-containing protein [Ditylenchus destructor]|nr:short chain dehydrogenase domain-containing protein [Ditylenchus destructor]
MPRALDSQLEQVAIWTFSGVVALIILAYLYKFLCWVIPGPRNQKRLNLKDRTVLITGASSGVGRSLAHEFYLKGAKLILLSRDTQKLHELCEELETYLEDLREKTESEILKELKTICAQAKDGKTIDVLVNNAGMMSYGSFKESPLVVVRRVMEVNFFGQVSLTKALLDHIPDDGAIVNLGSILGRVALPYQGVYSASKHAFQAYFDSLRGEERPQLQILNISAGYINTSLGSNALNVNGKPSGKQDPLLTKGYSPEFAAKAVVSAVENRETELLLAPFIPRLLLSLRIFTPNLMWWILCQRSNQEDVNKGK